MALSRSSSSDSLVLLTAELHLQDACDLREATKGKGRQDEPLSDDQFAMSLYAALLEADTTSIHDHRLAQSLDRAGNLDGELLEELIGDELRAQRDHNWALHLSQTGSPTISTQGSNGGSGWHSPQQSMGSTSLLALQTSVAAASSTSFPASGQRSPVNIVEQSFRRPERARLACTACGDQLLRALLVTVPCNHSYCFDCVKDLFNSAMTDESLMPPRCCRQEIPLASVSRLLGHDGVQQFEDKLREFGTKNRLYCPVPTCSTFIGETSTRRGTVQQCPKCCVDICSYCKTLNHPFWEPCGDDKDPASKLVLELGEREGWRRCGGCRRLVELNYGCYHMTCLCRYEFCYTCGEHWKQCLCPQWDEQRLLVAARDQVAAEGPPAAPAMRRARVLEVAQRLRVNHECHHPTGFTYDYGGGKCAWCHNRLREYLFRCDDCYLRVCNRCRRNRVY